MTHLEETEEESVDGNGVGGESRPGHVVGQEESDGGGQRGEVEIETASTVQYSAVQSVDTSGWPGRQRCR